MRLGRFALACTFVTGCGKILGVDEYAVGGPGGREAGPSGPLLIDGVKYASPACGLCLHDRCRPTAAACSGDSTCLLYAKCYAGCLPTDEECAARCGQIIRNTSRNLSPEMFELLRCRTAECATPCGATPKDENGKSCPMSIAPVACVGCCCAETRECFDDPICFRAFGCSVCPYANGPVSSADLLVNECARRCLGESADAGLDWVRKYDRLLECRTGQTCGSACSAPALADDWSCLGKIQWAEPSRDPIAIYVQLVALAAPIPSGVEISECPFSGCAVPAVSQTDGSGVATFPPLSDPISHTPVTEPYFRVNSMPGYYPLILWPYFPETHTALLWYPVPDQVTINKTAANAGVALDPTLGHIAFILSDCTGRPGNSLPVCLKLKTPNAKTRIVAGKTVPGPECVSDSAGLIFNLTPGTNTVETFVDADGGARVGSRDVLVEQGTFTLVSLQPTP